MFAPLTKNRSARSKSFEHGLELLTNPHHHSIALVTAVAARRNLDRLVDFDSGVDRAMNPHLVRQVFFVALDRLGPLIENHPLFPERVNVTLAEIVSRTALTIRTWERGAGLTRACGTAACASAVSAMRKNRADRKVTVTLPGGPLVVEWRADNRILMTGPADVEHEGDLAAVFAAPASGEPRLVPQGRLP